MCLLGWAFWVVVLAFPFVWLQSDEWREQHPHYARTILGVAVAPTAICVAVYPFVRLAAKLLHIPPHSERKRFFKACVRGDVEQVRELLDRWPGRWLVDLRDFYGQTPLLFAAQIGRSDIVQLLIARGANVNGTDMDHRPLKRAAENGHKDVLELLVANGADVNLPGRISVPAGREDIAELLREHGAKNWERWP